MDERNPTTDEPDWWFDGLSAWRSGFDRAVPDRVPAGEPTSLWLQGWDDGVQHG